MGPIPRMTPAAGIKAIDELSKHSLSWYKEEEYKENDYDKILKHINDFEHNISVLNEESDEDTCHSADIIDLFVVVSIKEILLQNHDNSIKPILDHLPEDCNNPDLFAANFIDGEIPTPKLKELPSHLEYAFLDNNRKLPVIISSLLSDQEKSPWVSPIYVVPKKGGTTMIAKKDNELIPTRTVTGWRVCIDYRKLNDATRKDHFPLPFLDQMLERLLVNEYYCFLDGFSGYFQIRLAPEDQEKTTFTCPYGTFAYRRMPFGLCNAPATFQQCMTEIFHDMCKDFICEEMNLVLNWEKCHFMVKEGIVLGHKISKAGIEVDKAKIDVIARNIMDEVDIEDLTIEHKSAPIQELAHYFGPNQPDAESDCNSEDIEEEVEYMIDDEVVMSEQEESNLGYTQNI
ncbi:reverse transcriptase domain-containing protein [Tanacetum coccineum]|uniref:Reverse transcriptase domain-containing protein n=1 Tax=Tanacetum coccineum TaxID=301880 RepID=A0ABQ5H241_9ASTR